MKPEEHAWRALHDHASAQLHDGFADRVLRAAHGPKPEAWQELNAHAAAQLRPGFAERVLRAARHLPGMPSFADQVFFSIGTAAVCVIAALFFHARQEKLQNERNLATWQQIAMVSADDDVEL